MKISVVFAVKDHAQQARIGWRSLLDQSFLPDEMVIVDDGSSDDLIQAFNEFRNSYPNLVWRYIRLEHSAPRISCYARNVGIKQSTGDIIIFSEAETFHCGETTKAICDALKKDVAYSIVSQCWRMGERLYRSLYPDKFNSNLFNHPYAQLILDGPSHNTKCPSSDWELTGHINQWVALYMGVKRDDLFAVGGWDESFTGYGWDDFDIQWRLEGLYKNSKNRNQFDRPIAMINDLAVIHLWHPKNYPYDIYWHSRQNQKIGSSRNGEYVVNQGIEWGKLD